MELTIIPDNLLHYISAVVSFFYCIIKDSLEFGRDINYNVVKVNITLQVHYAIYCLYQKS